MAVGLDPSPGGGDKIESGDGDSSSPKYTCGGQAAGILEVQLAALVEADAALDDGDKEASSASLGNGARPPPKLPVEAGPRDSPTESVGKNAPVEVDDAAANGEVSSPRIERVDVNLVMKPEADDWLLAELALREELLGEGDEVASAGRRRLRWRTGVRVGARRGGPRRGVRGGFGGRLRWSLCRCARAKSPREEAAQLKNAPVGVAEAEADVGLMAEDGDGDEVASAGVGDGARPLPNCLGEGAAGARDGDEVASAGVGDGARPPPNFPSEGSADPREELPAPEIERVGKTEAVMVADAAAHGELSSPRSEGVHGDAASVSEIKPEADGELLASLAETVEAFGDEDEVASAGVGDGACSPPKSPSEGASHDFPMVPNQLPAAETERARKKSLSPRKSQPVAATEADVEKRVNEVVIQIDTDSDADADTEGLPLIDSTSTTDQIRQINHSNLQNQGEIEEVSPTRASLSNDRAAVLSRILHDALDHLKNLQDEDCSCDDQILDVSAELMAQIARSCSPSARGKILELVLQDNEMDDSAARRNSMRNRLDKLQNDDDKLDVSALLMDGRRRRRLRGMWRTFLWTTISSAFSGAALYLLSTYMNSTELPHSTAEAGRTEWISWAVIKVIAPSLLIGLISVLHRLITEREKHLLRYKNNNQVNFRINALSKTAFFAVKDCPGLKGRELWAYIVAFTIELIGAFFLWWRNGYYEPDIADS